MSQQSPKRRALSVAKENFFRVMVAPACEKLPIVLADTGNLLNQTDNAIVCTRQLHLVS